MKEEKNKAQTEIKSSQNEKIKMAEKKQFAEFSQMSGDDGRDSGAVSSNASLPPQLVINTETRNESETINKQKQFFPEFS